MAIIIVLFSALLLCALMLRIHDRYILRGGVLHVTNDKREDMGMNIYGGKYQYKFPELWADELDLNKEEY